MIFTYSKKISFAFVPVLFVVICLYLLGNSSVTLAQTNAAFVREVRVLETDEMGVSNPAGLVFSPRANAFYVMEGRKRGQANTDLIKLTPFADRAGSARISAAIKDPRNMAFDKRLNRLLIFQSSSNKLIEVKEKPDGNLDPKTMIRYDAGHFGLVNPQGLTIDPVNGHLFFLDAAGPRLVQVEPEPDGTVDQAVISVVDIKSLGLVNASGIALDPTTSYLHLLAEKKLFELTQAGRVVATRDMTESGFKDPQGIVFAPSGDLTDDPSEISLYVTEQGSVPVSTTNEIGAAAPVADGVDPAAVSTTDGIIELTFAEPVAPAPAIAVGTLIQTIDTSRFSPPSPDPSGLAYLPDRGTLLIADGEVDEMSQYFTGDNLFEVSLTGALLNTYTTVPTSDEPAGVDVNPFNGHVFFGDDTGQKRVYELNPGTDGQYNSADDRYTSFLTSAFSSNDPEGIAYDPVNRVLYVIDGVNREIYRVAPGVNGVFDGIPSAGDDQVTHFDTLSLGLDDPEGGTYDPTSGHLYVVGKPAGTLFELTTGGSVVKTINISAANARKPAGLALAPSSVNPNELSMYIAARGVDNDSNPTENDGKLYEIALGITVGPPSDTPTSTPTNTKTPTPTNTSIQPTATNTPTPTNTLVQATATNTSTPTNTFLPTVTNTPTVTITPNGSGIILLPVADARVLQTNPTTNYGTGTRLDVDNPGEESYLRFTVSGVTGPVQSAILRLWVTNGSSNGPSLYRAGSGWTETGITWNNRPGATSGAVGNLGAVTASTWAEIDITAQITGNGTYDFVFMPDSTDGVSFYSREGSSKPQLVLTLQ